MNERPNGCNPSTGTYREVITCSMDRIYDSCTDKDCCVDLPIRFTDTAQSVIDGSADVKCKKAEVASVLVNVEPVPYNSGYFSVDITFYFRCLLETCACVGGRPSCVEGLAVYEKKVILYGAEGDSMVFSSQYTGSCNDGTTFSTNMPKATVEVVQPLALSARVVDTCSCCEQTPVPSVCIPEALAQSFEGSFGCCQPRRVVLVTVGLFSIVSMSRKVSLVVPACGFGVPLKESVASAEDPCALFGQIQFPTDQFFPPQIEDNGAAVPASGGSCPCR